MSHFDITEWADFVREAIPETARDSMQKHLSSGCARCAEMVTTLSSVVDDARAEARLAPPDWAVRTVHAYFGLMSSGPGRRRKLGFKLAFDSALEPAPAGIRGNAATERQRVYYSQEYALYLRMDNEDDRPTMSINGELVHRTEGPLPEVPTVLLAADKIIDSSLTGEFGDFRLGCDQTSTMRLCLLVSDDAMLELPLELSGDLGPEH